MARDIHRANCNKGFYEEPNKQFGTMLMLIVSELAEALEADRKENHCEMSLEALDRLARQDNLSFSADFKLAVKDTMEDELADALIRILDTAGYYKIDLDRHVALKLRFNALREKRHGKKY